jgi:hypothetical protein
MAVLKAGTKVLLDVRITGLDGLMEADVVAATTQAVETGTDMAMGHVQVTAIRAGMEVVEAIGVAVALTGKYLTFVVSTFILHKYRGWNDYGYDAGWVDNIVPQIIYAPAGFDYYNAPNYYDPYYTTVYVAEPTWDQPAYYPTVTVEGPAVTVAPDVGGFPITPPNVTIFLFSLQT